MALRVLAGGQSREQQREDRRRVLRRYESLKAERQPWLTHWRELTDFISPRRNGFLVSDRSQGNKRNGNIINNTATRARRILAAGMMAGITSPARPWFRITTPDPSLSGSYAVREWLHLVEERIRLAFARSNIYSALFSLYGDLSTIGVSPMLVEEDDEDLLRAYTFAPGSYCLANDERMRVSTAVREVSMTVEQVVDTFGLEACSDFTRGQYERGLLDTPVEIIHIIQPNRDWDGVKLGPRGKQFDSFWLEAKGDDSAGFLRQSGYYEFPIMAPRWETSGTNQYGDSPAMDALGDIRALQHLERRKGQAFDKIVTPPMVGPSSLMNSRTSLLPGETTFVDGLGSGAIFRPAMEINPQALGEFRASIAEHQQRIESAFYADLWLMLSQNNGTMTAREVAERHEEKLLQLGPVMERLTDELLDPLIDRAFGIELRRGHLGEVPKELQGVEMKVEFISIMAQAQRLLSTTGLERVSSFVGNLAAVVPTAVDKLNVDALIDEYALAVGVKPSVIRSQEDVDALRGKRDEAAAQQQEAATLESAVQGAQTLSQTDMQGDNALNRMLGNLGGLASAGVGQA